MSFREKRHYLFSEDICVAVTFAWKENSMNLFAYGTLMDTEIMSRVSGVQCSRKPAVLENYIRKCVQGEVYPAMTEKEDGSVAGVVYVDLSGVAIERLDRFEGSLYLRRNVIVACEDIGQVEACAYVIAPHFFHLLSDEGWDYNSFLMNEKENFQKKNSGYQEVD